MICDVCVCADVDLAALNGLGDTCKRAVDIERTVDDKHTALCKAAVAEDICFGILLAALVGLNESVVNVEFAVFGDIDGCTVFNRDDCAGHNLVCLIDCDGCAALDIEVVGVRNCKHHLTASVALQTEFACGDLSVYVDSGHAEVTEVDVADLCVYFLAGVVGNFERTSLVHPNKCAFALTGSVLDLIHKHDVLSRDARPEIKRGRTDHFCAVIDDLLALDVDRCKLHERELICVIQSVRIRTACVVVDCERLTERCAIHCGDRAVARHSSDHVKITAVCDLNAAVDDHLSVSARSVTLSGLIRLVLHTADDKFAVEGEFAVDGESDVRIYAAIPTHAGISAALRITRSIGLRICQNERHALQKREVCQRAILDDEYRAIGICSLRFVYRCVQRVADKRSVCADRFDDSLILGVVHNRNFHA